MAHYMSDFERFRRQQEQGERDMKHQENLKLLSEHLQVLPEEVMQFLRPGSGWEQMVSPDGEVIADSSDFADAPPGLTDPELVEWALQKIINRETPS